MLSKRNVLMQAVETAVSAGGGASAAALAAGWLAHKLDVSKKVSLGDKNEYQKVGEITVPIPTLEAFGIKAETRERNEAEDGPDDGLPIYKDEKIGWLFDAVIAACKMQARNKLVSGTAEMKEGQKIASTFEELTAEGERRGNAEALKLAKEVQVSFAAYVQGLGKSAATMAMLVGLFRNKQALSLQPDAAKEKMKGYLSAYAETLAEGDLTRYAKYLGSVEEACAPGAPSDF